MPRAHCSYPFCAEYKPCPIHTPVRASAFRRGYGGKRWKSARMTTLRRDPFCRCNYRVPTDLGPPCCPQYETATCIQTSNVADHYPKSREELVREGVSDPDDPKYLRGLSQSCHSRETNRLQRPGFLDR